MFEDADIIHRYSRTDALADGSLVDVTEVAGECGFRVPVALTRLAWADCVEWTDDDNAGTVYQDESGRLWDVLWMARLAAKRQPDASRLTFSIVRVQRGGRSPAPTEVPLVLDIGPGDEGEPVITIGFEEDF